ncbi:MAG: 2-C-methyl-D-erythritol 4-phosphate cytidylyltransferase [Candidatus Hydrogenedentes bacterium]|nr:2-C-methyl-D-erythritol 4-phosphate cytidylyltransferase [Candidatus Hydrogenedentota bacterium]
MRTQLLIPAAGMGTRLGASQPKALVNLAGTPLLVHTLRNFQSLDLIRDCLITVSASAREAYEKCLAAAFPDHAFELVDGGNERQDSVLNGLAALHRDTELVIIHDAARPFAPADAIRGSIDAAGEYGAATVAIPAVDTVLVADESGFLDNTPDRSLLWACQTPQTFRVEVIRAAHDAARRAGRMATDDATLVRLNGGRVKLVMGSPLNFKITTPMDMKVARCVLDGVTE